MPFDVEKLQQIACAAVGARKCVHFSKLAEGTNSHGIHKSCLTLLTGSYNKIFQLEFDNGSKAVARIPSAALVGNVRLSTASEVATMSYVREVLGIKVPKVIAWDGDATNPVHSAYIIMEHVAGVSLLSNWYDIRGQPVRHALASILTMQINLSTLPFSQIGSLYFKDDVTPALQACPLYNSQLDNARDDAQVYRIGPIAYRDWWCGHYHTDNADRGPCTLFPA